jgi:hypothetical protein
MIKILVVLILFAGTTAEAQCEGTEFVHKVSFERYGGVPYTTVFDFSPAGICGGKEPKFYKAYVEYGACVVKATCVLGNKNIDYDLSIKNGEIWGWEHIFKNGIGFPTVGWYITNTHRGVFGRYHVVGGKKTVSVTPKHIKEWCDGVPYYYHRERLGSRRHRVKVMCRRDGIDIDYTFDIDGRRVHIEKLELQDD